MTQQQEPPRSPNPDASTERPASAGIGSEPLTLGIISALVAGNIEAVSHLLVALAALDRHQADSIMQAIARGNEAARKSHDSETGASE